MKKTLNSFIKQSAQSKKGDSFVDNNPQARSNPYEPEMSIREGRVASAIDAVRRPIAVGTVGGATGSAALSDPNASTNRTIANTIDGGMSGNSGEVIAGSRAASGKVVRGGQRLAGVVAPSMRVRANAGAARESQRVATRAAEIAANRAAGRATLRTGLRSVGAVASKAAWPLAVVMTGYDAVKGYTAQPNAPVSRKLRNAAQNAASGLTFGAIPAPQGVNEAAGLILRGIKAVAPIVKRATAALEKRVAAKAAAADGSNVVKFVPKAAPPKVSVSTPRDATVLNMPKTTIGRAIVKAKAAKKPVTPTTAPTSSKPGTMSRLTGKAGSVLRGDTARNVGAQIATQGAIDAATPSHYTEPGKDPSMTPSGISLPRTALTVGAAALAGRNKAAWKSGAKWGAALAAGGEVLQHFQAKDDMSKPEYKKADADWREYYRKTGQQPQK
jgi:hypothetical protein